MSIGKYLKLSIVGCIILFVMSYYSIYLWLPHLDTLVGGIESAYNMHLSPLPFFESLDMHWSHRGVGYRAFCYFIISVIKFFFPPYVGSSIDGIVKIQIFFIGLAVFYQLGIGLSVFMARKKIKQIGFEPLLVFFILNIVQWLSRDFLGQPETIAMIFIYIYMGMALSENKILQSLSGLLVPIITSLKGVTVLILLVPAVFLLYCYYTKHLSFKSLLYIIISGIIGVIITAVFYLIIYPQELYSLLLGGRRYPWGQNTTIFTYIHRVFRGLFNDLIFSLWFVLYSVFVLKISSLWTKSKFFISHILFIILSISMFHFFKNIYYVPKIQELFPLSYSLYCIILAIILSGFFFYQRRYISFFIFLVLLASSQIYFYFQGMIYIYHLAPQGLALAYLILVAMPVLKDFFSDFLLKSWTFPILYTVLISMYIIYCLYPIQKKYHTSYFSGVTKFIVPTDKIFQELFYNYPEIKQESQLLIIGSMENVFSGIYNSFTYNHYYYDLLSSTYYYNDPFFKKFHQQIINYNDKYMLFSFAIETFTDKYNNTKSATPENFIQDLFEYDPKAAKKILDTYIPVTSFTNANMVLYLYSNSVIAQ